MADGGYLANPRRVALEVVAEVIAPPPPIDLNLWAVENIRFGSDSPKPGPYNPDLFPHFRRPLEVLGPEHPTRVVVMKKSAQVGGTILAQIFCGGSIALDPGGFLFYHPTEPNANRWAKQKWRPMVRQSPQLKSLFSDSSRDGGNSILYQERKDGRGWLQASGANSESSLSQVSAKRQVQDDLSKWEINTAGDPETQAESRSKAFVWAKILKISTPMLKDSCRISKAFAGSTQEYYQVPCPHCGHMQKLEWENFQTYIEAHPDSDPAFVCAAEECGGIIEQHHMPAMMLAGRWVAENPGASVVGFHLWAAQSPLERWTVIRDDWFAAKGDPAKEQRFYNDVLGRAYEQAGEAPPWETLRDRASEIGHRRGQIPPGGLILTVGADCQSDRVEVHVVAYGRDGRSWTVDYIVIPGHIGDEARPELNALLKRTWPDSFGNRREINMLAIDGNAWTEDVGEWVAKHPAGRVMMVRGARSDLAPAIAKVKKERNKEGKLKRFAGRFFNVGVSPLKMVLYRNLQKSDPLERGFVGLPQGMEDDFFQQLCAERRIRKNRKDGFAEYRWHLTDPNQRNEVLDTRIYADAAAYRCGWKSKSDDAWDALSAELEVQRPGAQSDLEEMLLQQPVTPGTAPAASPQSAGKPATAGFLKGLA